MIDILEWINSFFDFAQTSEIASYVFFAFIIVFAAVIALRIIVAMGYRVQHSLINVNAKPINARAGIKDTRSALLNKIVKDYVKLGEKGVTLYTSRNIIEKHVSRMNFIGVSYQALESFIGALEQNVILIGLVFTVVFESYRLPFALATTALFIIMRLASVFFNFNVVKQRLIQETSEYIDREIGQFFVGDISSLFTKFRNEISNSLHSQTQGLSEAIKKLGENIWGVLRLSVQEISKSVDISMDKLVGASKDINGSLENWQRIIELSANSQAMINEASGGFKDAAADFSRSSGEMKLTFSEMIGGVKESLGLMNGQIAELKENSQALQKLSEPILAMTGSLQGQLAYIERNQSLLETSMQKYELAMQDVTAKIGEGLGSIIEYHIQNSYNTLNERLEENIKQTVGNSNELILRLQQLFDEMRQLSLSETQAIIMMKDQMDIHFDNLSEKMSHE